MEKTTHHVFSGLDGNGPVGAPRSYLQYAGKSDDDTFLGVLRELTEDYGIETRDVGYWDDGDGHAEFHPDDHYVALVNPAWLGEGIHDAPRDSALWHIATESYAPADPMDTYGPLVPVARQEDHMGVFGQYITYRDGGEWAVDVFFDDIVVEGPGGDGNYALGFESSADYFGSSSLKAQVIAFDVDTGTVMRGLSEVYSTPHRGDAVDRVAEWYRTMLGRVEKIGDTLYGVVAEARETDIETQHVPFGVEGWYEAAGFPSTLASAAAERIRPAAIPFTAWDFYMAMARALTESYDGKRGGRTIRDHATRTNELLFAPKSVERDVLESARAELVGQKSLDPDDDAVDVVDDRIESLEGAVGEFETARDRIRGILSQLDDEPEVEA